ncbi:MAG TPA: precorrin-8X methylmutase [Firmicutes bacterium]|nr:precorrin-8X methylmutase [Bacillota bacterium]
MDNITYIKPMDIEKRSMEMIAEGLSGKEIAPENLDVVKRVIHTTADFEFADTLCFSDHAVSKGIEAIKNGICIVTDTNMALAGINKPALQKANCEAVCFMADPDVAAEAKERGVTRAVISVKKAAALHKPVILAVGNAPTALLEAYDLIQAGELTPKLIIGVPVGFVNVVESKELIMRAGIPYIVARGRKGGSTIAASIINALLYQAFPRE